MKVLGVVAKTHDSGIALLQNGVPELIFEEERFNRTKKTKKFPKYSLAAARADFGLSLADVDVITTPWDVRQLRKTAIRLLATIHPSAVLRADDQDGAYAGLVSDLSRVPSLLDSPQ